MTIRITQPMSSLLRQIWSMRSDGGYFGSEDDARLRGLISRGYVERGPSMNGQTSYFVTARGESFI